MGRDLSDRFARYKRLRTRADCDAVRDLHHQTPHDYGRFGLRTVVIDGKLDIRERNEVKRHIAGIFGDLFRKIDHLFPCAFACVRITVEMYRVERNAAFGDHIARDGTVDPAGEEEHGSSVRTDRHSSDRFHFLAVQIRVSFPDLHAEHDLGMMNVDLKGGKRLKQLMPEFPADHLGVIWKTFIRTSCKHLERVNAAGQSRKIPVKQFPCTVHDRVPVLFHGDCRTHGMDSEHLA